ncbi:DUF2868 domain-containing protein [Marinomonas balearica]|uniref:Uncharacterized protein DUF2868 n=1 Tax=Marinomonas balearica TaxID=491947 RepID=A0A4R6M3K8_9GAMM|nr:DUF2868 domain-containing protein [Marinomonas balearica]TDO95867.1 uncharacterized protein DUF2868 [Marinomonas balearica]
MKDSEKLALLKELNESKTTRKSDEAIAFFDLNYKPAFEKLEAVKKTVSLLVLGIALLLGLSIAPSTFDLSNGNKINVFWLLLLLLGANTFSMALWFITSLMRPSTNNHWHRCIQSIIQLCSHLIRVERNTVIAYQRLHLSNQNGKWITSAIMHSAWLCYLTGGLASITVFLITHEVHFVWETTLLSHADFQSFTQLLSTLPNLLGLSVPNGLEVQLSVISNPERLPALQQKWAYLILFSLVLYGVVPRLFLAILFGIKYKLSISQTIRRSLKEDHIAQREQHQTVVLDPDPNQNTNASPARFNIKQALPSDFKPPLFGFEWASSEVNGIALQRINNRNDQKHFIENCSSYDAFTLLVNGELCPDRGSYRFLMQVAQNSRHFKLLIFGETFKDQWVHSAHSAAIDFDKLLYCNLNKDDQSAD